MPSSDPNTTTNNPSGKIEISSNIRVDDKVLHEKITDHATGEVRVKDETEPHQEFQTTTTIASNNVKYEAKGVEEPHVTEGDAVELNPATVGCDTSQL